MLSLPITNPNGRPILPFDWLIHLSATKFCGWEVSWKLKLVKRKKYKQTARVIYYIYGNMVIFQPVILKRFRKVNIGCCCTLAAKIQSAFYERNLLHSAMSLSSSNFDNQAKSHFFATFHWVLLFLRSTFCFQFLCSEYGTVWGITQRQLNLHFFCTIITLKNLNNFVSVVGMFR